MIGDHLTSLLNDIDERRLEALLELFTEVELTIDRPPASGLMMLTVRDSFDTPFHLGEVLVTKATVSYHGCYGFGMAMGNAPRRALAKAAVDAVLRHPQKDALHERIHQFLAGCSQEVRQNRQTQAAVTAATRVNFDVMPGA